VVALALGLFDATLGCRVVALALGSFDACSFLKERLKKVI